jgi:hypothetical protein
MNSNTLLRELAIVIGEMNPKIVDAILEKLAERNEMFRIEFEILIHDLANNGEITIDI